MQDITLKQKQVVVRELETDFSHTRCILVIFGEVPSPMPVLNFVAYSLPRRRENNAVQHSKSSLASDVYQRFPEVWVYQCYWHPQVSM